MKNKPVYGAEDGTGAGDPPAVVVTPPADAGSVLYPDDPKVEPTVEPGTEKPAGDAPTEWKEYAPDPAKTDEENAAAKAEHDKTKPAADDPADKVPEDGKYVLKMPEGVEVDQELLDELSPEFKAAGLTGKQAQALTDKFIAKQQARMKAQGEGWAKTVSDWVDEAKKDPEIGGANWDGTVKTASGVVGRFGNDALKEYLNASGAGNHPEMIRFMAKVGAVIGEDNPAISETPGKKVAADTASILYPDDKPKGK
ncbi:hypothetical protein [Aminobacter ciceronei]|nr:hypothetical protein [Aminobacter ciceronei]